MKKSFIKPTIKRYDLRFKENIVTSWTPLDGVAGYTFHFHQNYQGNLVTEAQGCFDYLDFYYPTAGEMITKDAFLNFYTSVNIAQRGKDGRQDYGHEGYEDYINACEYP